MPGTELTEQQLREWYARFSREVLEKASIDVNRIEDVGRIKNYAIEEWGSLDDPHDCEIAKISEPTYAFMPHEGTECQTKRPEHVPIEEHMKQIESNREVFKAVYQGKEARTALMEYAAHKKNMTQDELKQAALDILYEDYLTKMSLDGTAPEFVTKPAVVAAVKEELIAKNNLDQFAAMDRFEVGTLAQSPLDFVKGLSAQNEQPVNENEMKPKEAVKL